MKRIVLTGGGTAGHVTPNIALVPKLREAGFDISYIGSYNGIEKELIEKMNIPYYGISSGKLRRYFDWKNFTDPFRVIKGFSEAKKLMKELNPDIVFSKGGFVSVPVVLAAHKRKIPVIIHESDMTPGLANKICIPSADVICVNFPEAAGELPEGKVVVTGTPIRSELFNGSREKGLKFIGFNDRKPVIMVVGGSTGAMAVNEAVRAALPELLKKYQVVHLCGKGKTDETKNGIEGYKQFEYISGELPDIFAAADLVISRAGANAICELLALKKPNILIPLSAQASRGDQILNAKSFEKQGYSYLLEEGEELSDKLIRAVEEVFNNRAAYVNAMESSGQTDAVNVIAALIEEHAK